MDLYWGHLSIVPCFSLIVFLESRILLPLFFYKVYLCFNLQRVDIRITSHRVLFHNSRCLLQGTHTFCLQSFKEQHNKGFHMQFLIFHQVCIDWRVQNQQFWYFCYDLVVDSQVWDHDARYHFYECIKPLLKFVA